MFYTLGIAGCGFVGSAVASGFEGIDDVHLMLVDPHKYGDLSETIKDTVKEAQMIFLCLPTPSVKGEYDVDISIVDSVLSEIESLYYNGIVVIKSSITPHHMNALIDKYFDLRIVYNPEFLTERNAAHDFQNPFCQILGGDMRDCQEVEDLYRQYSRVKTVPVFKTDITTACLAKYALNSFYATKVTFMNELYHLHRNSDAVSSWEDFTEILMTDPRMGNSHMSVPGSDGEFGFGGNCFPKDTKALLEYSENVVGIVFDLLRKAVEKNEEVRAGASPGKPLPYYDGL